LFRLTGDTNPLHADPERAKAAGFPRPILHGMASFGIAAHAVLRTAAEYQVDRLASIEVRFARPVFPGETVRTEMWRVGNDIAFRSRTVERGEIAINNGLAKLR
jgi:acyl dehydratase